MYASAFYRGLEFVKMNGELKGRLIKFSKNSASQKIHCTGVHNIGPNVINFFCK